MRPRCTFYHLLWARWLSVPLRVQAGPVATYRASVSINFTSDGLVGVGLVETVYGTLFGTRADLVELTWVPAEVAEEEVERLARVALRRARDLSGWAGH